MKLSVSNLPYQGLSVGMMDFLPKDIGVEVFIECGSTYYWNHWLPVLLKDRTGEFSVHGPFVNLDLSDPEADFTEIMDAFKWTFELCAKFGAGHCVCHPHCEKVPAEKELEKCRALTAERISKLNAEGLKDGVQLLVENMPQKKSLFDEKTFISTFEPVKELRFLIDTGHANLQQWDMQYAFEHIGDRIQGYHLNDNKGDQDTHLKVGEGTFDWDLFFRGYLKYTPDASLVCEYNHGPLDEIIASVSGIRKRLSDIGNGK
jgi:sugar phosphate isomerase/epimerase